MPARDNLNQAYRRVKANKRSRGSRRHDRRRTADPGSLDHKQELIASLLDGSYEPQTGAWGGNPQAGRRGAPIGHPDGGGPAGAASDPASAGTLAGPDLLGFELRFPAGTWSAIDALAQAQEYVAEGRGIVVDVDLEKFFDRVNHDILMARLARRVADKRLLRIVRRFLEAGLMQDGVCIERHEGTPQGGPLSPLLANLLLDDLDKELERRGHCFCRYADDCNIYVRSQGGGRAGAGLGLAFLEDVLRFESTGRKVRWHI